MPWVARRTRIRGQVGQLEGVVGPQTSGDDLPELGGYRLEEAAGSHR